MTKDDFDEHGPDTNMYTLRVREETIDRSSLELKKVSTNLLTLENAGGLEDRVTSLECLLQTLKADVMRLKGIQLLHQQAPLEYNCRSSKFQPSMVTS